MATASTATISTWQLLSEHLNTWFYQPDLEAVQAVMSAATAHYLCKADPVWMFVIGPSSSGKTGIIINLLRGIANAHVLGDVTAKTFISHYKGEQTGLLTHVKSGLFLFKDFTTMLSKRDDDRMEIAAQMREIYDGYWQRNTGTIANSVAWQGKITTIACATPALERAWGMKRELGERFVTVRWPRVGGAAMARAAGRQRGREDTIAQRTQELGREMITTASQRILVPLPEETAEACANLAEMVSILRGHVTRDTHGQREIIDVPNIEEPGRLNKSLELLACAHGCLFPNNSPNAAYKIAQRVGWDSVPYARRRLVECLSAGNTMSQSEISKLTGIPMSTVAWIGDELHALGVITITSNQTGVKDVALTPHLFDLLSASNLYSKHHLEISKNL